MILIVHFGSQVAHLIARRLRSLNVYSEIIFPDQISDDVLESAQAIILSGGPASVYDQKITYNKKIFNNDKPVLGICYGHQLIAHEFGGAVAASTRREFGSTIIKTKQNHPLCAGLQSSETVWMSHGDSIETMPTEFEILAQSEHCKAAIIAHKTKKIFGLQFHPEVQHTKNGTQFLENFITIAQIKRSWHTADVKKQLIQNIKDQVGNDHVVIGLSGGIDSLAAACLIKEAIGNRLHCIYVNTGLTRIGDTEHVEHVCKSLHFKNLHIINAETQFLERLHGVVDPEEKRKIIGHTFIEIFEQQIHRIEQQQNIIIQFLGQGTIYPDTIESASNATTAAKIKSHHNVTLPPMKLKLIEPLRNLYKDEVRQLATTLKIPDSFMQRHPFPGPGLAIRVVGSIDKEKLNIVRQADHIFIEELRKADLYHHVWQAFAALLPIKTVGVMGDQRTYDYIISLRAVTSSDGMTADWAKLPTSLLEIVSNRIVNEIRGVNRVVYDITQKPPATIEYE